MEPSTGMFDAVLNPTAAFYDPTVFLSTDTSEEDISPSRSSDSSSSPQIDAVPNLTLSEKPIQWRLDGADVDGTRFFAVPEFPNSFRPLLRVDVFIPDQNNHPPKLRHALQSNLTLLVQGPRTAQLGISQHILHALEHWSGSMPGFETQYKNLPFGSRIVIETICRDVREMEIVMVPIYDVEQQWLSRKALQVLWKFPDDFVWPESLDVSELRLERQPHEAISLVQIPRKHGDERRFVFKSLVRDLKYMYHELKMLLTMAPNQYIISRPLYIVTKKGRFGGKLGVCGFILEFFPHGTLRDLLRLSPSHTSPRPAINLRSQLRWSRQILSALLHIASTTPTYYPDLKPDNILMVPGPSASSSSTLHDDPVFSIKLIDLEQRGGWYSWSPPEVYYIEYLEYIASSPTSDPAVAAKYAALLRSYLSAWTPLSQITRYRDCERGYAAAWLSLGPAELESAQVFMLGKLLWCLFERSPSINCSLGTEIFREVTAFVATASTTTTKTTAAAAAADASNFGYDGNDDDEKEEEEEEEGEEYITFPTFKRTPEPLRPLITKCTAGAAEWRGVFRPIVRVGSRFYPRGEEPPRDSSNNGGGGGGSGGTAEETLSAAREWWKREVADGEEFLEARKCQCRRGKLKGLGEGDCDGGIARDENVGFTANGDVDDEIMVLKLARQRPSLREVDAILERLEVGLPG